MTLLPVCPGGSLGGELAQAQAPERTGDGEAALRPQTRAPAVVHHQGAIAQDARYRDRNPTSNLESYTMLSSTIGHQVAVIGLRASESLTTSRPFGNSTR